MKKNSVLNNIHNKKLVAVLRTDRVEDIYPTMDALITGGVNIIELTMTIPDVLKHLPSIEKKYNNEATLGVGSVLNAEVTQRISDSGISFIVSPITRKEIIETAVKNNLVVMGGAYTPTEIFNAREMGSDVVKVFPSDSLGPSYIKGVMTPMPFLKLLPTGGVKVDNVGKWLQAGAFALGVGSALVDIKAIRAGHFNVIKERAELFVQAVEEYNSTGT